MILHYKHVNLRFNFRQHTVYQLVIENKVSLREAVRALFSLFDNNTDEWSYIDVNYKPLIIDNDAFMVFDPFSLDPNKSTKLKTALINRLMLTIKTEQLLDTGDQLVFDIENFVEKVYALSQFSFNIETNSDFSMKEILKASGLRINLETDDFMQRLIDYMHCLQDLLNIKLFIFVNLFEYLSDDECDLILKTFHTMNCKVFLFNSRQTKLNTEIKSIVIDKDLCRLDNLDD